MATTRIWIFLLAVSMCNLCVTNANTSGARITLTSKALNYVSGLVVPLLEKELSELNIADISDKAKVKVIGKIEYSVKNIRITAFSIKSLTVSSSTAGITLELSDILLETKCDWKYKKWGVSDHGRAEIDIKHAAIKLTVLISKSSDGHPVLKVTKCEPNIPSLSVDLHGGASWFYKLFHNKMEDSLKKRLVSLLCDKAHVVDSKWNAKISSYPLRKEINQFTVTYGLLRDPEFTSTHIHFDLEGGVFPSVNDDVSTPPVQLPDVSSTDKMIYLLLTPKLFGSAITAAIQSGVLHHRVTPDMLPKDSMLKLNTLFFKSTVPMLFKSFPNMGVVLDVTINRHDEIFIDPAGIHVTLLGDILFQVIQSDDTTVDAFSIKMTVQSTLQVDVVHTADVPTVVLETVNLKIQFGGLSSSIGDFDTAPLEHALNGMSQFLLVPIINEYGRKGYAIPNVDNVKFVDPSVTVLQNCAQIGMDIVYS